MSEYMAKSTKNIFLADGFPRSKENIEVWEKKMADKVDFQFLLWFDLPGETMLERLLYRASQSKVKRSDDKADIMKRRIATFEGSIPLFDRYRQANQLVQVNAIGSKR